VIYDRLCVSLRHFLSVDDPAGLIIRPQEPGRGTAAPRAHEEAPPPGLLRPRLLPPRRHGVARKVVVGVESLVVALGRVAVLIHHRRRRRRHLLPGVRLSGLRRGLPQLEVHPARAAHARRDAHPLDPLDVARGRGAHDVDPGAQQTPVVPLLG